MAGAGSGKTRVITYRLARLVATGADPRRILAVTFTNKAAGELRERVGKLLVSGSSVAARACGSGRSTRSRRGCCASGARPSGCARTSSSTTTTIRSGCSARVLTDLKVPERMFPVRQVLSAIDRAKNQGITAAAFSPATTSTTWSAKAYQLYEERLAAANATDFGGLLLTALQLCVGDTPAAHELAERFDHVLVDEFQDTNSVQYRLVRCLSHRTGSITVVGDEDQSIYKLARRRHPQHPRLRARPRRARSVVKLEQNYRSTGHILRAANAIIARNTERRPKRLFTEAGDGEPHRAVRGRDRARRGRLRRGAHRRRAAARG